MWTAGAGIAVTLSGLIVTVIVCGRNVASVGVEDFAQLAQERCWRERLAEQGNSHVENAVLAERFVRIAGHVERAHRWAARRQRLAEFAPAHPRHDDIGQEELDLARVMFGDSD